MTLSVANAKFKGIIVSPLPPYYNKNKHSRKSCRGTDLRLRYYCTKGTSKMKEQPEQAKKEWERKRKFALYIKPSILKIAESWYEEDNCGSVSEFIEKAIQFYGGYVSTEQNPNYLPGIVISTLKAIIQSSDDRQNRMLFKIAVELSMMMNVLATMNENISREDLDSLRGHCVEEVKRINGCLSLNDAYRWQNG